MSECREIRELAALMPDGELDCAELERVRTHIAVCGDCRRAAAAYGAVSGAVRALKTDAPDTLVPGTVYKLSLPPERRGVKRFLPRAATLTAACLALVLILTAQKDTLFDHLFPDAGRDQHLLKNTAPSGAVSAEEPADGGAESGLDAILEGDLRCGIDSIPAEAPSQKAFTASGAQDELDAPPPAAASLLPPPETYRAAYAVMGVPPEDLVPLSQEGADGSVYIWLDEEGFNSAAASLSGELYEGNPDAMQWVLVFIP